MLPNDPAGGLPQCFVGGTKMRDRIARLEIAARHLIDCDERGRYSFWRFAQKSATCAGRICQLDKRIDDGVLKYAIVGFCGGLKQTRHRHVIANAAERFGRQSPICGIVVNQPSDDVSDQA